MRKSGRHRSTTSFFFFVSLPFGTESKKKKRVFRRFCNFLLRGFRVCSLVVSSFLLAPVVFSFFFYMARLAYWFRACGGLKGPQIGYSRSQPSSWQSLAIESLKHPLHRSINNHRKEIKKEKQKSKKKEERLREYRTLGIYMVDAQWKRH